MLIENDKYIFTKEQLLFTLDRVAFFQKAKDYNEAGHFLIVDEIIDKPKITELLDYLADYNTIVHDNIIEELIGWNEEN